MKVTHSSRGFVVMDQFLPDRDFKSLWGHLRHESYRSVHQDGWNKMFCHGTPMRGPLYSVNESDFSVDSLPPSKEMILFINRIRETLARLEPWIGRPFRSWKTFTAQSYLYPVGSGLPWHNDGGVKAAFTYYWHPFWSLNWGGELLVNETKSGKKATAGRTSQRTDLIHHSLNPFIHDSDESEVFGEGISIGVSPKPNRLVVIRGGHEHCIKRVEASAGDHARASIAGFFSGK